jgi:GGDEF domain-containing protein
MKEKNSKSGSSNNSEGKDESDSGRNKNKETVSKTNGKAASASDTRLTDIHSQRNSKRSSGNDVLNSIQNETRRPSEAGWESGIKILDAVKVIIPLKLLLVCNQIADRLSGEEFSILVNLTEKDKVISLSEEFHIPQQVVSNASIDYIPEDYNFNTVIHRHPDGMNSFSSTDKNFINQNFKLSILYTHRDGFVHGVYNLKHDNYLVQLPIEISVDMGLDLIDIQNIQTVRASRKEIDRRMDIDDERLIGNDRAYGSMFDSDDDLPFGRSMDRRFGHRGKRRIISDDKTSTFDLDKDGTEEEKRALKKLDEENLDYGLIKRLILEDVNDNIETLDMRLSNMEDFIQYSGHFI